MNETLLYLFMLYEMIDVFINTKRTQKAPTYRSAENVLNK